MWNNDALMRIILVYMFFFFTKLSIGDRGFVVHFLHFYARPELMNWFIVCVCVCVCVCACVRACVRACVCACVANSFRRQYLGSVRPVRGNKKYYRISTNATTTCVCWLSSTHLTCPGRKEVQSKWFPLHAGHLIIWVGIGRSMMLWPRCLTPNPLIQ